MTSNMRLLSGSEVAIVDCTVATVGANATLEHVTSRNCPMVIDIVIYTINRQ